MRIFLVTLFLMTFTITAAAETQYLMVVNAGSSSSKLYIYSYEQTAPNALPTNIQTVLKNSASPGLQDVNSVMLPNYMATLFSGAAKTFSAPLYFFCQRQHARRFSHYTKRHLSKYFSMD